jgi:hypothetical protein
MTDWHFGEFEEDGEAWLKNPTQLYAYVDYRTASGTWRRLMVATKSWLESHLASLEQTATTPRWALVPTMLILPDAEGIVLRQIVDRVMQETGFDSYSTEV